MRKLILIIEDDELLRSTIFDLLELADFNVISAEDGRSGLNLARKIQPDLVLCDVNTSDIDGYRILKQLRKNGTTSQMPFILLTSEYDPKIRSHALGLGANDYLVKPLQLHQLLEAISKASQSALIGK